ncbi:MAG: hypothetical protein CMQ19_02280 [Gammaproteobacteria bacterium]|jgi:hypothetical protein|nr:hypothetical protein [Gammaproteobacteria bacterium]|tara:strand:- start:10510 stop:10707 length:198 start_codon:yes stop_codon:yes gene_type:complete
MGGNLGHDEGCFAVYTLACSIRVGAMLRDDNISFRSLADGGLFSAASRVAAKKRNRAAFLIAITG